MTSAGVEYVFNRVELHFDSNQHKDVFAMKNNKSLGETLMHHRYAKLANKAQQFSAFMEVPVGEFLVALKREGNPFYKCFLNRHGDKSYSTFSIHVPEVLTAKGIYAYYAGDRLQYIGRCRDTMKKRINQGYGKIHPKNCYLDGQSTNCRLNAKITEAGKSVSLWFCPLESDAEICSAESLLIRNHCPDWNVQSS